MDLRNRSYLEGVEEDLFLAYEQLFETLERDKKLLSPGQYIEMKYEDFEQDILGELKKIYEHFQMPGWSDLEAVISPQIAGLKQYKKNEFKMEESLKRQIYERCKPCSRSMDIRACWTRRHRWRDGGNGEAGQKRILPWRLKKIRQPGYRNGS